MRRFRAILAQDGVETAEGPVSRVFPTGCFTWVPEELPLAIRYVQEDEGAHRGAMFLGVMERVERQGNFVVATGVLDDEGTGEAADDRRDVIRQIENGHRNRLSVDPGNGGVEVEEECTAYDEDGWCEAIRITFTRYSIGAATLVHTPALQGTLIELLPDEDEASPTAEEALDAIAASAAQLDEYLPPVDWFDNPELAELTRVPVVTEDGRVYGHLAGWSDCHLNFADYCQTPWRSAAAYAYFHTCSIEVEDPEARGPIQVGVLSVEGGHWTTDPADPRTRDWQAAQAHYDDPRSVAAYVRVGEDEHGIWFAGALRSGVSAEQVRLFRAHQLSGDWRRIDGHMELIAGCSVNVPGFVRSVAVAASAADGSPEPLAAVVAGVRQRGAAAVEEHACACGGGTTAAPVQNVTVIGLDPAVAAQLDAMAASIRRLETVHEDSLREHFRERMRDSAHATT
jgi:hypothetical protein